MTESLKLINEKLTELEDNKFWGKIVIEIKGGIPFVLKLEETIILTKTTIKKEKSQKKTWQNIKSVQY